jgi:hypothetical protein
MYSMSAPCRACRAFRVPTTVRFLQFSKCVGFPFSPSMGDSTILVCGCWCAGEVQTVHRWQTLAGVRAELCDHGGLELGSSSTQLGKLLPLDCKQLLRFRTGRQRR